MNTQEKIKFAIYDLVKKARTMTVDEAITYIKENFPENQFVWDKTDESYDIYVNQIDVIHLSAEPFDQLVIKYPGGNKYGPYFSEPHTSIYFKMINDESVTDFYLFINDKYNEENRILDYLVVESSIDTLSVEEILNRLNKSFFEFPNEILSKISETQLKDTQIIAAIVSCVEKFATLRSKDAYEEYMFGQPDGVEFEEWQLSISEQFKYIWGALPKNIQAACHKELNNKFLSLPFDTVANVSNTDVKPENAEEPVEIINSSEPHMLEERELSDMDREFLKSLKVNREKYIQDIHNKYEIMRNHKEYLALIKSDENYSVGADVSYLDSRLENVDITVSLNSDMEKLAEITSNVNVLVEENKKYEQENQALASKKYFFWQGNKKQRAMDKIESNKVIVAKNEETIEGLVAQQNKMQHLVDIRISFQKDISEMIKSNPMKGLPHIYKLFTEEGKDKYADNYVLYNTDLRNVSEKEYVAQIDKKITQIILASSKT